MWLRSAEEAACYPRGMAGGPFAQQMTCLMCALDGLVVCATRVQEGEEDDQFECPDGHGFAVNFSRGAPKAPVWPPSAGEVQAIEAMGKAMGRKS